MKTQKVIRIVCILCTAILWVSIIVIVEIYGGAFLKKNILSLLVQSKTYEMGYEYYQEQVNETLQSNLVPYEQTFEVITQQRFYVAKLNFAEYALKGEKYEYDSRVIQDELTHHLIEYISNEEGQLSIQAEQQIDEYSSKVVNLFFECANSTVLDSIYEMKIRFLNFIKWLLPILILCIVQFIFTLFHIHSHKIKAIQDICYASLVSVLLGITLYIGMKSWLRPENYMVGPEFYQSFVSNYIAQINGIFGYGIWVLSLLYCSLIVVMQLSKGYLKEKD